MHHETSNAHPYTFDQVLRGEAVARISLQVGLAALAMHDVLRVPRKANGEHENNSEHSFMLSLLAPALAHEFYPDLDKGLIAQFANVHDLVEIVTGDVATFNVSSEELADKAAREHAAVQQLLGELDPYTGSLLVRYEEQVEPEARFVRMVDKLLPLVVDILGDG